MRLEGLPVRRFGHFREPDTLIEQGKTPTHTHTHTHTQSLSHTHTNTHARTHIPFGVILAQQGEWQHGQGSTARETQLLERMRFSPWTGTQTGSERTG